MSSPVDDRLRLLQQVLALIESDDITASPAQVAFLRGVELGLEAHDPDGNGHSSRTDAAAPEPDPTC